MSAQRKKKMGPNKGGGKFNHPKSRIQGLVGGGGGEDGLGKKGSSKFDLTELYYGPDSDNDNDDSKNDRDEDQGGDATSFSGGVCAWKSATEKKSTLKVQLQTLHMTNENQQLVQKLLVQLHSDKLVSAIIKPDIGMNGKKDIVNKNHHLGRHYWTNDNKLRLEGAFKFNTGNAKDTEGKMMEQEKSRVNRWAIKRLMEAGFHELRAQRALEENDGDVGESLEKLLAEAFDIRNDSSDEAPEMEEIKTMREDEMMALTSIYDEMFQEKIPDKQWIIKLQLDHIKRLVFKSDAKETTTTSSEDNKPICTFFVRGKCRYGNKCLKRHVLPSKDEDTSHTTKPLLAHEQFEKALQIEEEHAFRLELRFPKGNLYPYHMPFLSFYSLKENFPQPLCLLITERLVEEAKPLCEANMPIVFSLIGVLEDEKEIRILSTKLPHKFSLPPPVISARASRNQFEEDKFEKKEDSVVDDSVDHFKKRFVPDRIDITKMLKQNKDSIDFFHQMVSNPKYVKMLQGRRGLPAWDSGQSILTALGREQVLVISGMTGCGKTTQVPQFILDDSLMRGDAGTVANIICTQPRRISAIGVAERVAEERAEKIGRTVGYQIRMESKQSQMTRLLFCTTGILLRRMEADRCLEGVTHVIVDEVHERSEESDFLLLILRDMLPFRPDLRVILMSATVDANLFSNYFAGCQVIDIPGRTFPVQQFFLEDMIEAANYRMDGNSEYSRMEAVADRKGPSIDEQLDETFGIVRAIEHQAKLVDELLNVRQLCARYYGFSRSTIRTLAMYNFEMVNLDLIEDTLKFIVEGDHEYPRGGAILIFLPGIAEISNMKDQLTSHPIFGDGHRFRVLPLHSSLSSGDQQQVFSQMPRGIQKIVLSTNIAETSVTIDDIIFVIDCGKMKETHYDSSKGMESLDMVWVSRANALQRKGRAGRVTSGVAFHMFTSHRFKSILRAQPIPEIHRVPLEQMLLRIKSLPVFEGQVLDAVLSRTLEPPVVRSVDDAVRRLQDLGALDRHKQLTPLGYHLALLPLDVRLGKLILYGAILQCVDAALTIAAMLTSRSLFLSPFGSRDEADRKKREFSIACSDHLTMWNAYNKWLIVCKEHGFSSGFAFAQSNFLSVRTMEEIGSMKRQFAELLSSIGFLSSDDPKSAISRRHAEQVARQTRGDGVREVTGEMANRNSNNHKVVAAVLVGALYPNVVQVRTPETKYQTSVMGTIPQSFKPEDIKFATKEDGYVSIHPSSVNFKTKYYDSPYLVYLEKVKTSKIYIRDCTMVPLFALALFGGGQLTLEMDRGEFIVFLDNGWLTFKVSSREVGELTQSLRREIDVLLQEKIDHADEGLSKCPRGNLIVETVATLLSTQ